MFIITSDFLIGIILNIRKVRKIPVKNDKEVSFNNSKLNDDTFTFSSKSLYFILNIEGD